MICTLHLREICSHQRGGNLVVLSARFSFRLTRPQPFKQLCTWGCHTALSVPGPQENKSIKEVHLLRVSSLHGKELSLMRRAENASDKNSDPEAVSYLIFGIPAEQKSNSHRPAYQTNFTATLH